MRKKRIIIGVLGCIGMLVLILDGRTAISSMQDGIKICLQTVIPALFPFFLLSPILTSTFYGVTPGIFKSIYRACKLPNGCESIFLVGLISGYPIGAQLITQAYQNGMLSKSSAKRMLGFCSNAGPAFIFGMLSSLFTKTITPWILWFIQILSAILVGILLPCKEDASKYKSEIKPTTNLSEILQKALKSMASVCGWVLVFRVILGFLQRWFLWLLPMEVQILFSGVLELANGCVLLSNLSNEPLRFLYSGVFLAFGGLCVSMQTASVTKDLGFGMYFPGKLLQSLISVVLCTFVMPILFSKFYNTIPFFAMSFVPIIVVILLVRTKGRKKVVAFE